MRRSTILLIVLFAALGLLWQLETARAAITWTGDIQPSNPLTWYYDVGYIGKTADGSLTVNGGDDIRLHAGYIAYDSGVTGQVTITGAGSSWDNFLQLYIGYQGNGTLTITDGGDVSNEGGYIGLFPGSTGEVTVSGTGSTWTNTHLDVGGYFIDSEGGNGTLTITDGGTVSSYGATISGSPASTGNVTVSGAGSTWTDSRGLSVGSKGNGTLAISEGGTVTVSGRTEVAYYPSSTGTIDFGSGGGTLTTESLCSSPADIMGTGTINTCSLVSDVDLIFDTVASLTQTLHFDSEPGQDITVNLDMSGAGIVPDLGAGWGGSGSLVIRDGITVQSGYGCIGLQSGSTGVATVSGTGSTWNNDKTLHVGSYGNGTLAITNGGTVNNARSNVVIGEESYSTGEILVSGTGSTLTTGSNSTDIYSVVVGSYGNGALTITDGGTVINEASNS